MALTATATLSTRKYVISSLNMRNPAIVYMSPLKNNIIFYVVNKPKEGIEPAFKPIVQRLIVNNSNTGRIIIFCCTYQGDFKITAQEDSPSSTFLYICLRIIRNTPVDNLPYIRTVDAHSESNRCDYHTQARL